MNKIDCYNSWLCKAASMVCLAVCVLALAGCNEDEANSIKEDPYAGGRAPLAVIVGKAISGVCRTERKSYF